MNGTHGNLTRLMETVITGCDLSNEQGRKEAYDRCVRYADEHLAQSLECNLFLAHAAERLGQTQVMKDVVHSLVPVPEGARLHLSYQPDYGPVLTGNSAGLKYLAELAGTLAQAPLAGEHVHLEWNEPPFNGDTYGLIIYREEEEWFEEAAEEFGEYDEDAEEPSRSEIKAEDVFALQLLGEPSPGMSLRVNRVYPVLAMTKQCGEDVFSKAIREDDTRVWVFTVRDDEGEIFKLGLDLDDPDINFLTRADLIQFLH
jgi:hypothetical protein